MNKTLQIFLITIISFALYFVLDDIYFKDVRKGLIEMINQGGISHIIAYAIFGTPIILGSILIHNLKEFIGSLGLNKSIAEGILFSLICTLPMLVGFAVVFNFNSEITINDLLIKVIAAAFFEELYFRGFLFGQLFRYTKLGFLPSVIIGALLFGIIHFYQSTDLTILVGIFLTTLLGAILFAWAYVEWNYNLWIPVFLHLFMNLFWQMFSAGENALGGIYANVFRISALVLIILLTVLYKRKKGYALEVNRKTIWMKYKSQSCQLA
jgi:uncharacterized protein